MYGAEKMRTQKTRTRSNITPYRREAYVQGSAVRKLEPVKRPKQEERKKEAPRVERRRAQKKQAQTLSLGYTVTLAVIAAAVLFVCTQYLKLQAEGVQAAKEIASLENQLSDLKEANNDEYNRVMTSIDLDEIKERAINDLGMVYAAENQIIAFDGSVKDYMKQYEEIPETESSILEDILASK